MKLADRIILGTAVLALLGSLLLILDTRFESLFSDDAASASQQTVGEITFAKNDLRQRRSEDFSWNPAEKKSKINLGDRIFTGEKSGAQIKLNNGGQLELDEKTLVIFTSIDGIDVPELDTGNFRIRTNGKVQVSIGGELTEINGSENTEVQVVLSPDGKPQFRLLSGTASVKMGRSEQQKLVLNQMTQIVARRPAQAERAIPVLPPSLQLSSDRQQIPLRIFDEYAYNQAQRIVRKTERSVAFKVRLPLAWQGMTIRSTAHIEVSTSPAFPAEKTFALSGDSSPLWTSEIYEGLNYLRIKSNASDWSDTQTLLIERTLLRLATPKSRLSQENAILQIAPGEQAQVLFDVSHSDFTSFVFETSQDPFFAAEKTEVSWQRNLEFNSAFDRPGTYYLRVRGLNEQKELSEFSETTVIRVTEPITEVPPLLLARQNPMPEATASTPEPVLSPLQIPDREVTTSTPVTSTHTTLDIAEWRWNQKFQSSTVAVEGSAFTMFSSSQESLSQTAPVALTAGLRLKKWWESWGFEGFLRSQVAGLNPSGSSAKPLQVEARGGYRIPMNWNLFSDWQRSQLNLVMGAELYQNSTTSAFAKRYSLLKTGFQLQFPLLSRFDTGGEVVYGLGTDNSKKTEISGFLNYFVKSDWSFGAGYRIHLFEAGSAASSGSSLLPYREAFGEAFSVLRWHY